MQMNPSEKDVKDSWNELLVNVKAYAQLQNGAMEIQITHYAMVKLKCRLHDIKIWNAQPRLPGQMGGEPAKKNDPQKYHDTQLRPNRQWIHKKLTNVSESYSYFLGGNTPIIETIIILKNKV